MARIAAGADGLNRGLRAPGEPLWWWHVTSFEGFADSTIEILDGWPGYVEQDVAGWIANANATIGFWTYTVVEELGPVPEPARPALVATGLVMLLLAPGRPRGARNLTSMPDPFLNCR